MVMQRFCAILMVFFSFSVVHSQELSPEHTMYMRKAEDSMKVFAKKMIFDEIPNNRFLADTIFIKQLVESLKTPNSFYYPFDSLMTVSVLYAPDSAFRIFSWQLQKDETYFRQFGAIQMNTADGTLQLYPLIDMSEFDSSPTDTVKSPSNWIGAIYYRILLNEHEGKKYYTLLGYDDNDFFSTRKWIDVLTFDNNVPVFGEKLFEYKPDALKPEQPAYRFCLEYKKDARARLNYDEEMKMIVFDHLISQTDKLSEKFSLIPDGDYEGFKWENGKWVHVEKIFDQSLEDGQAPVPQPYYDDNGNPIE